MLGVRLGSDIERKLNDFVRHRRRAKSEVARTAIAEYLDRHAPDDEFDRQLAANALDESGGEARADLEFLDAAAWATVDRLA